MKATARHLGPMAATLVLLGLLIAVTGLERQRERLFAARDRREFLVGAASDAEAVQRGLTLRELRYTLAPPGGWTQLQRRLVLGGWRREGRIPGEGVYYTRSHLRAYVTEVAYLRWEPATRRVRIGTAICVVGLGCR